MEHESAGVSIMEVLIALIVLGIITTIFFQTTSSSMRNVGRSSNWQKEAVAVEKTIENLRRTKAASHLRTLDSTGIDISSGTAIRVRVKGAVPPPSICAGFACDSLAQITVVAQRTNYPDSLRISTYIFAKAQ